MTSTGWMMRNSGLQVVETCDYPRLTKGVDLKDKRHMKTLNQRMTTTYRLPMAIEHASANGLGPD